MGLEASIVHMLNDRQGVRVLLYLQLISDDARHHKERDAEHCLLLEFAEVHCRSSCFH